MRPLVPSDKTKPNVTDLVKHGKELWDKKDIVSALVDYRIAATIESKNAKIQASIGFLFTQQSNFPKAIAAFQRAIQLDNKDAKSLIGLGFIYAYPQHFLILLPF